MIVNKLLGYYTYEIFYILDIVFIKDCCCEFEKSSVTNSDSSSRSIFWLSSFKFIFEIKFTDSPERADAFTDPVIWSKFSIFYYKGFLSYTISSKICLRSSKPKLFLLDSLIELLFLIMLDELLWKLKEFRIS